ncbi:MAG TPA: molybdopterin cofactor-binding domain-containing protein [Burkholderiaceae bacterium]|jgi:2-furoyl-CoA dehydrogenase large subunit|nr:molybdopterin cofactor-binding domain-containing protein [Burkholderiaceae bacterium]
MHRDADLSRIVAPHVGRARERLEDSTLLTGRGQYADDLGVKPGTLHAAIVRSPHAHAYVRGIDTTRALASPGVRAVLIGEDVKRWSQPFVAGVKAPVHHWALAIDRVRYVGEPVAVVVAEDRYLAEDGADLVRVEYEPLPPVVSIDDALAADAPLLHPEVGSNVVSDRRFSYGDPDRAFAAAAHVIRLSARYPRNSCTPIECGVVLAEWLPAEGAYDVVSNFMGPFSLHAVMALALQVPGNKLRHRVPRDSGGSFGVKQAVFPAAVLMCLAARKAGAPVKWVEDRVEHLTAATSATARSTEIEAAVDAGGRVLALRYEQVDEVGAYLRAPEPATFYRMHGVLTGAYDIANLAVRNRVVVLNKTPTGLVRGFGGPQVYFALERLMDRIAAQLRIDPIELRRRNYVRREQFPYRAAAGALLDSGDYHAVTDDAVTAARLDELRARQRTARAEGRLYGIGCAAVVEPSISNMGYITTALTPAQRAKAGPKSGAIASATVAIDPLGGVTVTIASAPAGQGHMTVCAQIAADAFGLAPEQIVVNVEFDTQKDAWSVAAGNYSSRFAGAVAGTVHLAAMQLRAKLARIAAAQLRCDPTAVRFMQGKVFAEGANDQVLPFARVAGLAHWSPALLPEGMAPGLRETAFFSPDSLAAPDENDRVNTSAAYGFVFDIVGLEVDRDTGRVCVDRYVTAHDAGRLLNPALVDGQIRGGFAQGLGAALYEELHYGADGSFQSGTLADYAVPTCCEVPDPVIVHRETPSPFTPLGAKGVGEGNNMSTPPAIANAVADALRPLHGEVDLVLPLTPARVLAHLGQAEPPAPMGIARTEVPTGAAGGARGAVALRAHGQLEIAAPPERVFAVLLDPVALAKVIPGCHALESIGPNRYRADVAVGVGVVKARYRAQIDLADIDPPHSVRLVGSGTSSLGTGSGEGRLRLERTATGTRLHYDYEARVSGKVAAVGSRMLEGAARMLLAELFNALGRQASGAAPLTVWQRLLRFLGIRR